MKLSKSQRKIVLLVIGVNSFLFPLELLAFRYGFFSLDESSRSQLGLLFLPPFLISVFALFLACDNLCNTGNKGVHKKVTNVLLGFFSFCTTLLLIVLYVFFVFR